jgi:hypothetical protein
MNKYDEELLDLVLPELPEELKVSLFEKDGSNEPTSLWERMQTQLIWDTLIQNNKATHEEKKSAMKKNEHSQRLIAKLELMSETELVKLMLQIEVDHTGNDNSAVFLDILLEGLPDCMQEFRDIMPIEEAPHWINTFFFPLVLHWYENTASRSSMLFWSLRGQRSLVLIHILQKWEPLRKLALVDVWHLSMAHNSRDIVDIPKPVCWRETLLKEAPEDVRSFFGELPVFEKRTLLFNSISAVIDSNYDKMIMEMSRGCKFEDYVFDVIMKDVDAKSIARVSSLVIVGVMKIQSHQSDFTTSMAQDSQDRELLLELFIGAPKRTKTEIEILPPEDTECLLLGLFDKVCGEGTISHSLPQTHIPIATDQKKSFMRSIAKDKNLCRKMFSNIEVMSPTHPVKKIGTEIQRSQESREARGQPHHRMCEM